MEENDEEENIKWQENKKEKIEEKNGRQQSGLLQKCEQNSAGRISPYVRTGHEQRTDGIVCPSIDRRQ